MEKTNADLMLPDRRFLVHPSDLAHKAQVRKERQWLTDSEDLRNAPTHRKDNRGFQASTRDVVNANVTSGLVLHLAADRQDVGCARDTKCFLQTLWHTRIIAQQDASEQRRLRFGKDLRDDVLGTRLERVQPSK